MSQIRVFLFSLVCLAACGDSSSNGTFACEGATTVQCANSNQYCELVTAAMVTTATCRALPASCNTGSNPCDCISSMSDGGRSTSCASASFGGVRQTTITFSR